MKTVKPLPVKMQAMMTCDTPLEEYAQYFSQRTPEELEEISLTLAADTIAAYASGIIERLGGAMHIMGMFEMWMVMNRKNMEGVIPRGFGKS